MTNTTNPADAVEVIQSDRVRAADLLDELSSLLDHNGIGQVADLIRDGEYDEHEATLAFARHRLAVISSTQRDTTGKPASSIEYHQMRGRALDTIDWAVLEYDEFMKDDAYDAQRVLDRIIARLREVADESRSHLREPGQ